MKSPSMITTTSPFRMLDPVEWLTRAAHLAENTAWHDWPQTTVALAVSAGTVVSGLRALRRNRRTRLMVGARVLEIACPPESSPAGALTLWGNLLGLHRPRLARLLHGQPHLAFEYVFTGRDLSIRLWVPGTVPPGMVERAIEAAWPGARAKPLPLPISPLPPPAPRDAVTGGRLLLARSEALPLAVKHETDPLRPLTGAGSALNLGQGACLQILVKPAAASRAAKARRRLRVLEGKAHHSTKAVLFDALSPGVRRTGPSMVMDARLSADARAAAGKLAGPLYEAEIRYAAFVPDAGISAHPNAMMQARGIAHAIASATCVYAERNHLRRRRLRNPHHYLAQRTMGRGQLYAVAELAALAHLPWDVNAPGLTRAGARSTPPAPAIPSHDESEFDGGTGAVKVLGDADAGPPRPIALPVADSRQHLHILGKTGSGKSTLLANLVLQDAAAGRGQVVIDPNGDLINNILDRLPDIALDRPVVLFDPSDASLLVPRVNMLDGAEPYLAVDHLVGIFSKIYSGFWGPRTDDLLRAACLTLILAERSTDLPFPTLADVPELLSNPPLRRRYTDGLDPRQHKILRGFWNAYEQHSDASRAAMSAPLLNKLRAFLMRDYPAEVVATGPTDVDLDAVLAGGLLLARLPKGVLGEDSSRLLGSFLVAKTWQTATARAGHQPAHGRPDASLVIDEAHNYLNLPLGVEDMLAEARGYRLSLTLAHQDLGQLPTTMREAVSANARNKIYFNASPEDATRLARHTLPNLGEHDLARLGAYQAATRVVVQGTEQPACTLATRPMPPPVPGRAEQIRALLTTATVPSTTPNPNIPEETP